ncbi:MAG: hypothetical protein KDC13_06790 [Bacteroidetes bacterium]|nr:hypothetical protein [Bacteroidota bacterium]
MTKSAILIQFLFSFFTINAQVFELELIPDCKPHFRNKIYPLLCFTNTGEACSINVLLEISQNEIPSAARNEPDLNEIIDCFLPTLCLDKSNGIIILFYSKKYHAEFFSERIKLFSQLCKEKLFILLCVCQDSMIEEYLNHGLCYEK